MHIPLAVVALKISLEAQNQFILFYVIKSETSLGNIKLSQTNKKPKP